MSQAPHILLEEVVQLGWGEASLRLQGSIPDMTALTATYLELQRIYRERADADHAALAAHVHSIEQSTGQPVKIASSAIRNFAKNARNLRYFLLWLTGA